MSLLPISGIFWFLLVVATEISAIPTDWLSNANDCSAVRDNFNNRNLTLFYLHPSPRQDHTLRVCSKETNSCCNDAVERQLFHHGIDFFQKKLYGQIQKLSTNLRKMFNKFHQYFKDLLNDAKRDFHTMFTKTYGIIYVQNSYLFTDFFHLLEEYYASGKLNLDEVLEKFFISLYQRMFEVLNAQYKFDAKYLSCVVDLMKDIRPFGNHAELFSVKMKNSFISTRTFSRSLDIGAKVSANMLKVNLTEECLKSFLKMQFCSGCSGVLEIKACSNYCINVMKGCLAHFIELNDEWVNYIDAFDKITEKLLGEYNIITVVEPMDVKISDAIMKFQDNGVIVSQRIFNSCGKPNITRKARATSNRYHSRQKFRTKRNNKRRRKPKSNFKKSAEDRREELLRDFRLIITDIRMNVKEFKHFWSHLPYQICNNKNISEGPSRDIDCWNGTVVDRYVPPIVRDGFRNQRDNPSVIVDVSKRNSVLHEQKFLLKSISKKLQVLYDAINVNWFDEDDFDTMSGSGFMDDGDKDFEDNWRTFAPPIDSPPPSDRPIVIVHSGNKSISSTVSIPETTTILTPNKTDNNSSSSRQTVPHSLLGLSVLVMFSFYF